MIDAPPSSRHEWARWAVGCADLGVFLLDETTRAVTLDARAGEMLGLEAERPLAFADYLAAVDASDRDRVTRHIDAALAHDDPYHDEFRTGGKRWLSADGRLRREPGGRGALFAILCDVTLRRTTEDARTRLVDEMARSLRFNDMLIGVVAHDLKTPLAAVLAGAEVLERRGGDEEAVRSTAERIARSGDRMSRIIDQLLDLTHARLDGSIALRTRESDLAALVRSNAAEITAADPRARIAVEVRGDPTAMCDPDRVAQILANLLANAVRHGSDAGDIRVLIDGTGSRALSITVRNPGRITADAMPSLFNPFRRVRGEGAPRDKTHGLGLGLYIARRIALGHGGDITVTSDDATGTAFRIDLPRTATSTSFSLTPDRAEEEEISLQRLGISEQESRVTAALFGVLPIHERAPDAFAALVDRHVRLLGLALDRQIFREARVDLASELRTLAEQLGAMGAGASDVAELHSHALQRAIKGAPAVKAQALVSEGRLLALELMGRLVTFYRKRSGFGALARGKGEAP
jgi:signal transduction histidine kinase